MSAATVDPAQRFTARHPCPICGGGHDLPQGRGVRCFGYLGADRQYAHCTREEYAGGLDLKPESNTYAHKLSGSCRCGQTHGEPDPQPVRPFRRAGAANANGRVYRDFRAAGAIAAYDYQDEAGTILFQVWRYPARADGKKDFKQARPGPDGWALGIEGVRRVPYRLPGLLAADPTQWVLIPEGEKDVDRLTELGFVATTNPMGAGNWRSEYSEHLRGRRVCLLLDNDPDGETHSAKTGGELAGIATEPRVLRLPGLPTKGDVSDWLDAGGTADELARLIEEAPIWEPAAGPDPEPAGEVPEFPLDVLPSPVRAYVQAAAESLSVPAEMVAVVLLALAGALIGNRLHLVLKTSWREYATLYLAIVARPGSAKSPALNLAKWPLDALQKDAHDRYTEQIAAYEAERARWKAGGQKQGEPEPEKPRLRHYFSTDLTVEALAGMLAGVPGVAVVRDEISGWVAAMDQYKGGKGSDRQQYLSLWSAQTLKVDRKSGGSLYVPEPVACVVGGIQPDLAGMLHDAAQRRDGFVERILPVVPDVEPARWTDAAPSTEQYRDVLAVFRVLDQLGYPTARNGPGPPCGHGVNLSPEARALWVSWHDENSELIAASEGLAAGFYSKLPAHVARLALILHALWQPDDPRVMVPAERMQDAIELGEFFRVHIRRFLALLHAATPPCTAGTETRVLRILRKAKDDEYGGWVARTTVYRGLRTVTAAELTTALDRLVEAGRIEWRSATTATKPGDEYRIAHSHNSQYSDSGRTAGANSANSANSESEHDEVWDDGEPVARLRL
jgi:hypothetical protein